MFKSICNIDAIKRSESESGTSRLQSWNNLVDMITDKRKPRMLRVFLDHYTDGDKLSRVNNKNSKFTCVGSDNWLIMFRPLRNANCASFVMASASSSSTNFTEDLALQD